MDLQTDTLLRPCVEGTAVLQVQGGPGVNLKETQSGVSRYCIVQSCSRPSRPWQQPKLLPQSKAAVTITKSRSFPCSNELYRSCEQSKDPAS